MSSTTQVQWPSPIVKYDIHVYWLPNSKRQRKLAETLYNSAKSNFPHLMYGQLIDRPIGPHPYSMFEIDIYNCVDFATVVPWVALNHGELSVLIHPHTGNHYKDHAVHGLWLGEKVPLDYDMLRRI